MNPALESIASRSAELRKSHLLDGKQACSEDRCESPALIMLGTKPWCLHHFITRCYEWLDCLDPLIRRRIFAQSETSRVQSMVKECSNRALLVSLRCEELTNLDRSRLLDILVRSSDLLFQLRVPRNEFPLLFEQRAKSRTSKAPNGVRSAKSASSVG